MNRNGAQLQAAKPLGTVTNNYRPRQFRSRRTASCISAQTPPRLGYKDERGMLFFEMVKILRERKPRFFIAENVKGLLSTNKGQAYPMIMKEFSDAGYKVVHKLLNAFD